MLETTYLSSNILSVKIVAFLAHEISFEKSSNFLESFEVINTGRTGEECVIGM